MAGVQNIESVSAVMDPDNLVHLRSVSPDFFHALERDFGDFNRHVLISHHAFDEPWPTWEIHPEGDELVLLLSGDSDLVLAGEGHVESVVRVTRPGDYVLVPKGTWHTARPHAPTSMLFITPGQGTINALTPGGEPVQA